MDSISLKKPTELFQYTAARRRLGSCSRNSPEVFCFNTQPPEGGCGVPCHSFFSTAVSIHSRPKAAGYIKPGSLRLSWFQYTAARRRLKIIGLPSGAVFGFNTQPPEGGCSSSSAISLSSRGFNTQPPEGGWKGKTHEKNEYHVSIHSRPKAAVSSFEEGLSKAQVSIHSRPKAAGSCPPIRRSLFCFNTQPPEGGWWLRRTINCFPSVSIHSRPKAAAGKVGDGYAICCFNTQPPEGGCLLKIRLMFWIPGFNTQPPEGG